MILTAGAAGHPRRTNAATSCQSTLSAIASATGPANPRRASWVTRQACTLLASGSELSCGAPTADRRCPVHVLFLSAVRLPIVVATDAGMRRGLARFGLLRGAGRRVRAGWTVSEGHRDVLLGTPLGLKCLQRHRCTIGLRQGRLHHRARP
jgi:hypothetical protein